MGMSTSCVVVEAEVTLYAGMRIQSPVPTPEESVRRYWMRMVFVFGSKPPLVFWPYRPRSKTTCTTAESDSTKMFWSTYSFSLVFDSRLPDP